MRNDIQFLRGLSVFAVLIYHANIGLFSNGYLGVDVFFVISGYLITSSILAGISRGSFSFKGFYLRRAYRLLPALYCTLAFTTLLAYPVLLHSQWQDYLAQLYGAITFTSNIVLPLQTGYFADAAETKPLLHIWSLSLEEQYYFLIPAVLVLLTTTRAPRTLTIGALTVLSLGLYLVANHWPGSSTELAGATLHDWSFYLLPTRAWELFAGSLIASLHKEGFRPRIPRAVLACCFTALTLLLAYSGDWHFWGEARIAAIALAFILLATDGDWMENLRVLRPMTKLGDWSYSVYLVHWPLFCFAFIAYLGQIPAWTSYSLIAVSLVLGGLQYHYIEQRFRHAYTAVSPRLAMGGIMAATIGVISLTIPHSLSLAGQISASPVHSANFREVNHGLTWQCARGMKKYWPSHCSTTESPEIAVWGDSYAMHLVPGLQGHPQVNAGLVQLTKSECNPALGLTGIVSTVSAANACLEFNQSAVDYILETKSIKRVIISSPFGYFYGGQYGFLHRGKIIDRDFTLAQTSLAETIEKITNRGKQVTIISAPPTSGTDTGACLERQLSGALLLGRTHCNIDYPTASGRIRPVRESLEVVQSKTKVKIVWLHDYLCNERECEAMLDDVPIYRDKGHLSIPGSKALLSRVRLFD